MNSVPKNKRFEVEVRGFFDDDSFRMMLRLLKDYGSVRQMSFDAHSNAPAALAKFMVFTLHDAKTIRDVLSTVSRNSEVTVEEINA